MTDIHIPAKALEAGARAIAESLRTARLTLETEDGYKPEARAAFLAIVEAWPGGGWQQITGPNDTLSSSLILPLPTQENGDE